MLYREINGISIAETEIENIVDEIIEILSQKNITHAIANMILDEVKDKLMNTIIKKDEEKTSTFGKNVKLQGYHQSNYENNNNLVHQVKKDLKEYKDKIKETKFI